MSTLTLISVCLSGQMLHDLKIAAFHRQMHLNNFCVTLLAKGLAKYDSEALLPAEVRLSYLVPGQNELRSLTLSSELAQKARALAYKNFITTQVVIRYVLQKELELHGVRPPFRNPTL